MANWAQTAPIVLSLIEREPKALHFKSGQKLSRATINQRLPFLLTTNPFLFEPAMSAQGQKRRLLTNRVKLVAETRQ